MPRTSYGKWVTLCSKYIILINQEGIIKKKVKVFAPDREEKGKCYYTDGIMTNK